MDVLYLIIIAVLLIGFTAAFVLFQRHYARELKREVRRAQKSEQLKSVFLANVSQALRSPLKAIKGYSNLILEESDTHMQAAQVKEMATHISANSDQLLSFIAQLKELSNYDASMPSLTLIEVNVAELMASYRREALMATKPDVGVQIRTDLSPHCKATLDTNSMHQLMMHLLNNAAKHTTQGDIVMHYANERRGIKVAITYQGNGQSNVIGEDIFSYLQREEALTMVNGTDVLSIPICKAIVDALGGELDITTENGQKTTVTFWFPCRMRDRNKGV